MSLQNNVVSLPVAKELQVKLREAGIEIKGNYCYVRIRKGNSPWSEFRFWGRHFPFNDCFKSQTDTIPTYTLDEMLRVLPSEIKIKKNEIYGLKVLKCRDDYLVEYSRVDFESFSEENFILGDKTKTESSIYDKNPATAAAKLWLWCIENGHLK